MLDLCVRAEIQTSGAGLQHLALKTDDIFATIRAMRAAGAAGGFDFMPRSSDAYYRKLPSRIGDALTPQQYKEVEELGEWAAGRSSSGSRQKQQQAAGSSSRQRQ